MNSLKKSIITAVLVALCVVLPVALHGIPNAGVFLSPMHFPVLLAGLVCGPFYGLFCGIAGPILSFFTTGMPGAPILPSMTVELASYGLFAGLLMSFVRTGRTAADVYVSLVGAMILGRVVGGVAKALIFSRGSYSLAAWATGYFVSTVPAMVLQLAILPLVFMTLSKANLIPDRYDE